MTWLKEDYNAGGSLLFFMEEEMKTIEISINLDPINDRIIFHDNDGTEHCKGGLVIATNGDYKVVSVKEVKGILDSLADDMEGSHLGNSPYIAIMNAKSIFNVESGNCFVGSALIMKRKNICLEPLEEDDFEEAKKEFISRLTTLVCGDQEFSALEI